MTMISRYTLPKRLEDQMHALFRRAIIDLKKEQDVVEFLNDLLSPTEKIMLGKRLAIAVLIRKKYDHRSICRMMKVSLATISSVHVQMKFHGEGYQRVIDKILQDEMWGHIFEDLTKSFEDMLRSGRGAPPRIPWEEKPVTKFEAK